MGQSDEFTSYMIQDVALLYSLSLNPHLRFCKKPCFSITSDNCTGSQIDSRFYQYFRKAGIFQVFPFVRLNRDKTG